MRTGRIAAILVAAAGPLAACASVPDAVRPPVPGEAPVETARPANAPAPSLPDLAAPVRLADLLGQALARSPRIAAARASLEAASERRPQDTALPDPMIEGTWYARNAMAEGRSYARYDLMLRQSFPLPAVLALRGDAADKGTEAAALRYEATVRDVFADVESVHAERGYLAAAETVQARLRDVFQRYAEIARTAMNDGALRLPEAFRAEALAAQAEYDLGVLRSLRRIQDERLRALIALPPGVAVGPPADMRPVLPLDVSDAALMEQALTWNQELREAGVDVERAEIGIRQAKWAYAPAFTAGVGLMKNDRFDMETGRKDDSVVVSLGVTLPIWQHALSARVREAKARERAARAVESDRRVTLAADVAETAFRVRNAQKLAELYAKTLVPQAESALSLADVRLRDGKESLTTSLELASAWQQLSLAQLRAAADHAQALANLERLVGSPVVPVATPAHDGGVR